MSEHTAAGSLPDISDDKQASSENVEASQPQQKTRAKKIALAALMTVLLVFLVAAGLGAYLYLNASSNPTDSGSSTSQKADPKAFSGVEGLKPRPVTTTEGPEEDVKKPENLLPASPKTDEPAEQKPDEVPGRVLADIMDRMDALESRVSALNDEASDREDAFIEQIMGQVLQLIEQKTTPVKLTQDEMASDLKSLEKRLNEIAGQLNALRSSNQSGPSEPTASPKKNISDPPGLSGIMVWNGEYVAMVDHASKIKLMRTGDRVDGWRIESVSKTAVTWRNGDVEKVKRP